MEILHTPPVPSSYTSLTLHQSRTPVSFYEGPPVLHYHSGRCKVIILGSDLKALPALNTLRGPAFDSNGGEVNGSATATTTTALERNDAELNPLDDEEVVIDDVDIWVASE
jgi:chloride channel, nucleotide-sensitive, 1A